MLLLHPLTKQLMDSFVNSEAHALLLSGSLGAGKRTVAEFVAATKLGSKLETAPYFLSVKSEGKSITIEQARQIQSFLQLKTTGNSAIRRVILIEDADCMTLEAQNALLKSLEEPPADTLIIMTLQNLGGVLETIQSRSQHVAIRRVALDDAVTYFAKEFKPADVQWAYAISDGQVGLMRALLDNKSEHDVAAMIQAAKALYGMSTFERLAKVDESSKDKEKLSALLYACKRIAISALESAAKKNNNKSVEQWYKQLKHVCEAEEGLKHNPNSKLLLTDLFIHI